MDVKKRDGTIEEYNFDKILSAITKAFMSVEKAIPARFLKKVKDSFDEMVERCENGEGKCCVDIEEIQDLLEDMILDYLNADYKDVKKEFIRYRHERVIAREAKMLEQVNNLFQGSDEYLMKENANKKAELTNVQQSYLGGILSTYYCRTKVFSKRVLEGHDKGAYHIHDMDMRAMEGITNCCLINLKNALYYEDGTVSTVLNDIGIDAQKKFSVACTVATQILQGVSGLQYGGMTITLSHLIPALKSSIEQIKHDAEKYQVADKDFYFKDQYEKTIRDGIQTFMYQVNSMFTTQG